MVNETEFLNMTTTSLDWAANLSNLDDYLVLVLQVVIIFILVYVLTKVLNKVMLALFRRLGVPEYYQMPICRFTSLFVWFVAILFMLEAIGITGVMFAGLAGAGVLTIVVGFAAQSTLANIIAGFVLFIDRPFIVGDWVKIGNNEGIVKDISLRATRIRTRSSEWISIPNSVVEKEAIINMTRSAKARLKLKIPVPYEMDAENAEKILLKAVEGEEDIMTTPEPKVRLIGFGKSYVDMELRVWVTKSNLIHRRGIMSNIYKKVKKALEKEGYSIPYPHIEVVQHKGGG
jgi:small-conductance mechanosensitive channel